MMLRKLHHVTFHVSDLDATERFANDFGLLTVEKAGQRLVMATQGGDSYSYVAYQSDEPKFIGLAFEVADEADLAQAIADHGASDVVEMDLPGGGRSVSLFDPNGFRVELVHGIASKPALQSYPEWQMNSPLGYPRAGRFEPKRPLAPAKLFRLGHIGLFVPSYLATQAWYKDVLGLIPSDVYHVPGQPHVQIVGFLRLDHGEDLVDHHSVALMQSMDGRVDCHHISFEAQDFEAQFMAHRYLETQGYELVWGVGRHPHGSHVFDVWRDPDRNRFETFSDTDRLKKSDGTRIHNIHDVEMDVWRSDPPDRYFS
ncbi:VOC family protein [Novosphingobium capsulatum]|nr:VOC family protein [Novosphingobium capsulatum]